VEPLCLFRWPGIAVVANAEVLNGLAAMHPDPH
jgi:hypothetical protein